MNDWVQAVGKLEESGSPYTLITLLGSRGSTPRESGTKMLVAEDETYCSIGGGHLEYKAIQIARDMLASGEAQQRIENFPLGPGLGQCCGGSTSVLFETFPGSRVNIMLFGAGHVGTALIAILGQLPCRVQWVDSREAQFPASLPDNVRAVVSDSPEHEVALMPAASYYIVMTHNHPLDFAITEAVVKRGDARYVGLIGSATKWRRFQMRFDHRGYSSSDIASVRCPVGLGAVPGKLPMEVATSIAGEIIAAYQSDFPEMASQRGVAWRELKDTVAAQLSNEQAAAAKATASCKDEP